MRRSIREAADDRSVDMGEPTEPPPPVESGTGAISQPRSQSTVQLARSVYVAHAKACRKCQDIDRDRCSDGQELWRAWERACDEAYRQLAEQAP